MITGKDLSDVLDTLSVGQTMEVCTKKDCGAFIVGVLTGGLKNSDMFN